MSQISTLCGFTAGFAVHLKCLWISPPAHCSREVFAQCKCSSPRIQAKDDSHYECNWDWLICWLPNIFIYVMTIITQKAFSDAFKKPSSMACFSWVQRFNWAMNLGISIVAWTEVMKTSLPVVPPFHTHTHTHTHVHTHTHTFSFIRMS